MEEKDRIFESLKKGLCPDCKGREFYSGPEGGLSKNYKCANRLCGSEFWFSPLDAGRIDRPDEESKRVYGWS